MLARQRQQPILDEVTRTGAVKVADLVSVLGVSDMTIRRDIGELAGQGLVDRVHGGAALPGTVSVHEPGFATKATQQVEAKLAIAKAASRLVRPGSSLGISAGTTTHAVATQLLDIAQLTVVTNSLPVADELRGVVALQTTGRFGEIDVLITDDQIADDARDELSGLVGELVVAGRGTA
ncbi:DeoR/GlpR family DNA-binding transcription regulator [Pseudonocardia acidicola]|uniref:DeoR/GlpR transcriptional regulator n=1 Tax=Pseudonocardia acidicola TaxID=2724939 RepID=A0ABX1SIM5_9PSEU|nr:DeoR/GlpR family DNA-binding transcription regulator [Pseudonocardia acidicola]NMI01427.1 DeoR/GlpR transcriptional regulator [Pseudonocardia acidicola]